MTYTVSFYHCCHAASEHNMPDVSEAFFVLVHIHLQVASRITLCIIISAV